MAIITSSKGSRYRAWFLWGGRNTICMCHSRCLGNDTNTRPMKLYIVSGVINSALLKVSLHIAQDTPSYYKIDAPPPPASLVYFQIPHPCTFFSPGKSILDSDARVAHVEVTTQACSSLCKILNTDLTHSLMFPSGYNWYPVLVVRNVPSALVAVSKEKKDNISHTYQGQKTATHHGGLPAQIT